MQKVIADITQTFHLNEKQVAQNGNLLMVLGQSNDNFVIQLYGCAVVLFFLVLIASVLMITSSLNSNVMQRTEFFGMLRCIGATKKQIMSIVRREGLRWCKFAIPGGLAGGVVVVWILCDVCMDICIGFCVFMWCMCVYFVYVVWVYDCVMHMCVSMQCVVFVCLVCYIYVVCMCVMWYVYV